MGTIEKEVDKFRNGKISLQELEERLQNSSVAEDGVWLAVGEIMKDLENQVKRQNIMLAMAISMIWVFFLSLAYLYIKLDRWNFATKLIGG